MKKLRKLGFWYLVKPGFLKKPGFSIAPLAFGLLALGIFIILINLQSQRATATDGLPPLKIHPLPASLARWEDETNTGDYFEEVEATAAGYLIWSRFPIAVYIQPPQNGQDPREWVETVAAAVMEWDDYLPLEIVEEGSEPDIVIINKRPPISLDNMRARSAEARYQFYLQEVPRPGKDRDSDVADAEGPEIDGREILSHRFVIWLSPMQKGKYLPAAARHEFGHALGIWGHSLEETDVMYYSQVGEPPSISARDINTLKRIYQQPTRLGWEFALE
jgi:predicted Zn-dependent protease